MLFSKLVELIHSDSRFSHALVLCLSGGQSILVVKLIISAV